MSLVKVIRKNERKIMGVVVALIMVAFVGAAGLRGCQNRQSGMNKTIGTYLNGKVTPAIRSQARSEMEILARLGAKDFLQNQQLMTGGANFKTLLLSQLLFPDAQMGGMIANELKRSASQGQLKINDEDIESFFSNLNKYPNDIYWILLKAEARQNGYVVGVEEGKQTLKQIIPQLSGGRYDAAILVNQMIADSRLTEGQIVSVFSSLLSVMAYSDAILSNEDVTANQIRSMIGRMNEKVSAEYVKFAASDYIAEQTEPMAGEIISQFDKYKSFTAGPSSEENPYGFGYKLPGRVQLEYIIVKVDDVRNITAPPQAEEMESYFQRNLESFKETVKVNPEDPASETFQKQKSYVEVAEQIQRQLIKRSTSNQLDMIMNESLKLTDAGLSVEDFEAGDLVKIKSKIADYNKVAEKVGEKFGVKVYSGKTGYLSLEQFESDLYLGRLMIESGRRQTPLSKALFAIDQVGVTTLSQFDGKVPSLWENIGPMKDQFGRIAALIRIVDGKKPEVAIDSNVSYSTKSVEIDGIIDEGVYSVKDSVIADVKALAANKTAKSKADALVAAASKSTWEAAIADYNKKLDKPSDPNQLVIGKIRLDTLPETGIGSKEQIASLKKNISDNPMMASYFNKTLTSMMLADQLRSIPKKGTSEALNVNSVTELKADNSYYAIKDVKVKQATKQEYAEMKANVTVMVDVSSAASGAVIYYNAGNLVDRMEFSFKKQEEDSETEEAVK
jgi:hypothetical protein